MRKVCIVRRKYYPGQRNVRRDAEALIKAGYSVDVICTGYSGQKKSEILDGANIYRIILPYNRGNALLVFTDYVLFFLISFFKLSWFTIKKRYDVIEIDTMPDFLVYITLISRVLGSKVVLYMFEDMPTLFMSSYHVGPKHLGTRILRIFEKWSAVYADHVIVSDGQHYKRTLEGRGIPSNKITVILNVPDNEVFKFKSKSTSLSDNSSHFRLAVVSTLVKRYGVQTLVKAIPLVIKQIPELQVDIVGDGDFRPELQKIARELQVEKQINFRGLVDYDKVPEIISQATICLAPMKDDVGLPNKLFEYFALGKPAIVSSQPSLIEAFGRNGTVSFFEPDNEEDLAKRILELYFHPEKRESLIAHGYRFYDNCRWSIIKQNYLNIYEELLKR
jgi:glycosyltransferase involved in cell wall biosynthesis